MAAAVIPFRIVAASASEPRDSYMYLTGFAKIYKSNSTSSVN